MKKFAFTMAEILLSLTIIGVVAAITLPSLMGNINERTWNTQKKALHARLSQAIGMMPYLSGYGTQTTDADGSLTADTAAEAFLTEGLSKVVKINNICDSEHLEDCGLSTIVTDYFGSTAYSVIPKTLGEFNSEQYGALANVNTATKAAAFETQNGESVLTYYNPNCIGSRDNINSYIASNACATFVFDLNGNKGPNMVGKDVGIITAFYPVDSLVVAPDVAAILSGGVSGVDGETASAHCSANYSGARMANIEEAMALSIGRTLYSVNGNYFGIISSTVAGNNSDGTLQVWGIDNTRVTKNDQSSQTGFFCIKR